MSSATVRAAINAEVSALASPWPVFDVSDYQTLQDVSSTISAESVLVQYVAADDQMQTIGGYGNQGWQETGSVVLHLIVPTGFDSAPAIAKGDSIREGIRGKRLTPSLVVQNCSPFVDFGSSSIGIDGAVHGFAAYLFYVNRDCG